MLRAWAAQMCCSVGASASSVIARSVASTTSRSVLRIRTSADPVASLGYAVSITSWISGTFSACSANRVSVSASGTYGASLTSASENSVRISQMQLMNSSI